MGEKHQFPQEVMMDIEPLSDWRTRSAADRYRTYPNSQEIAFVRISNGYELVKLAMTGLEEIDRRANEVTDRAPGLTQGCRELEYAYLQCAKGITVRYMGGA
jgi:hypothetical protein